MPDILNIGTNVSILTNSKLIDTFLEYTETKCTEFNILNIYASMDFEFDNDNRTHVLSLGQIQFTAIEPVSGEINRSQIFFYDPRIFNQKQKERFINFLVCPITKILHGSESLDLPAIRKYIGHDELFERFLATAVDTRFLCEANGIINKVTTPVKCSIYSALYDLNLISQHEYSKLSKLKIDYRKKWFLTNLTNDQITYAAIDIAFLYNLYVEYLYRLDRPTAISSIKLSQIVTESYRYTILDRYDLVKLPNKSPESVKDLIASLSVETHGFTVDDLLKIDYLRKSLTKLMKN